MNTLDDSRFKAMSSVVRAEGYHEAHDATQTDRRRRPRVMSIRRWAHRPVRRVWSTGTDFLSWLIPSRRRDRDETVA